MEHKKILLMICGGLGLFVGIITGLVAFGANMFQSYECVLIGLAGFVAGVGLGLGAYGGMMFHKKK